MATSIEWGVDVAQPANRGKTNVVFADESGIIGASNTRESYQEPLGLPRTEFTSNEDGYEMEPTVKQETSAKLRRMSRKFVGTLRRNQYQREQLLLRHLDSSSVENVATFDGTDAVADGGIIQSPSELKSMTTLNLRQKRKILHQMKDKFSHDTFRSTETLKRLRSGLDSKMRLARNQISGAIYTLGFWQSHLKAVQGHFGTDVTAYFVFLRWLFLANVFIGLIVLLFVFIPRMADRFLSPATRASPYPKANFTGEELLTGKGWFENTEMYYGFYGNTTLNIAQQLPYDVPLAYLLAMGSYVAIFFITMAFSTARSYRTNFIESSSEFRFYYVTKVLVGWDCGILDHSTAKERKKSLLRELQEYVSSLRSTGQTTDLAAIVVRSIILVVLQLAVIGGAGYLTYYLLIEYKVKDQLQVENKLLIGDLVVGIIITGLNGLLPVLFYLASNLQKFETEKSSILSTLIMTCLLYCSTLGALMASLLQPHYESKPIECWETYVGQQLYQLAILDFIYSIFVMLFKDVGHKLLSKALPKKVTASQFDIATNTQNLMYSQVLCWLGIYYVPMITVVTVIKLFILFYLKRYVTMATCVPNSKHWKGAQMQTWFLIILFIFFILCSIAFGVVISMLRPSTECGPFRYGLEAPVDLVFRSGNIIVNVIVSPGTMVVIIVALCVAAHYTRVVSNGKHELVRLLREQITLECKDKVFLQKLLDQIEKTKMSRKRTLASAGASDGAVAQRGGAAPGRHEPVAPPGDGSRASGQQQMRTMQQTMSSADLGSTSSLQGGKKVFARARNSRPPDEGSPYVQGPRHGNVAE